MSFVCPPSVLHKKVQSTSQACVTAPVAFTVSDRRGLSLGAVLSHKSNSWSIGPNTQTREPLLISRSPLDLSVFLSLSRTHTHTQGRPPGDVLTSVRNHEQRGGRTDVQGMCAWCVCSVTLWQDPWDPCNQAVHPPAHQCLRASSHSPTPCPTTDFLLLQLLVLPG